MYRRTALPLEASDGLDEALRVGHYYLVGKVGDRHREDATLDGLADFEAGLVLRERTVTLLLDELDETLPKLRVLDRIPYGLESLLGDPVAGGHVPVEEYLHPLAG